MLRTAQELTVNHMNDFRGGKGPFTTTNILNADEFCGKGRLFTKSSLEPGSSIGLHKHEGDFEVYYFLRGQGMYNDGTNTFSVNPGDVTICPAGQSHGLENTGSEPLDFIALILYS